MSKIVSKVNKFTFTWKIYNFSLCCYKKDQVLLSPIFVSKSIKETQWCLKLYPRGHNNELYMACYLARCKSEDEVDEIDIKYKIEFITESGILESRKSDKVTFQKKGSKGWVTFMEIDDVWESIRSTGDDTLTIKCHMTEVKPEPATICNGVTKFCAERNSFKWCLKYNSHLLDESHKFHCGEPWRIALISVPCSDDISITIQRINKECDSARAVQCELSLLDVNGFKIKTRKSEHFFESNNNDLWSFPEFFTKSELMSAMYHYVKDETFTLKCQFSVSNGRALEEIEGYDDDDSHISHSLLTNETCVALQEDLQRMYLDHVQTDIKLQCENEFFQAHKCLLSARSPVFAAMFRQDMLENQTSVVDIVDVQAAILDTFLRFIYSGIMEDMDCEKASKLLIVAEKYQVISLKEKCSSFLKSNLTTENVCDILAAAYMSREEDLTSAVVDFIVTHSEIILHSEAWYQCVKKNAILATEILCKVSAKLGNGNNSSK